MVAAEVKNRLLVRGLWLRNALAGSLAATITAALLYGCAATPMGNTSAHDADGSLPAPDGLGVCAQDSPLKAMFASMASRAGELAGCFMSRQTVPVWGEPRAVNYPSEYAYAIKLSERTSGPYTRQDIEANLGRIQEEWKNYPPLWKERKPQYEKRVADLLDSTAGTAAEPLHLSLEQPVLVSIDRLGDASYSVVSIRQRKMSMDDNSFVTTAIDGTGLVLIDGRLTRVSLVRELQTSKDIDFVKKAIAVWIRAIQQAHRTH